MPVSREYGEVSPFFIIYKIQSFLSFPGAFLSPFGENDNAGKSGIRKKVSPFFIIYKIQSFLSFPGAFLSPFRGK